MVDRAEMMAHLCNIPDIYWKGLKRDDSQAGAASHWVNAEEVHLPLKDLPTDWKKISELAGAEQAALEKVGSLWWRANQLLVRARESAQNPAEFLTDLGLAGHFVGDAAMPYHNTRDHDGYGTGHGGIHIYYEISVVNALPLDLDQKVFNLAQNLSCPGNDSLSWVEQMKQLSSASFKNIKEIEKIDSVLTSSRMEAVKKIPAQRRPPPAVMGKFAPLIHRHLATAARCLARFWDQAYVQSGRPDFSQFKGFHHPEYPLMPDYVVIHY